MSSFIPTTGAAQGPNSHISSKLIIAMVGCLFAFVAIVAGFLLVARKSCCALRPADANASLPSYHGAHTHNTATRRGSPVASLRDIRLCSRCLTRAGKRDDRSPRISLESLSSPPPPYLAAASHPLPPRRPRGPTSWISISRPASFERAPVTATASPTFAPPASPPGPPPSYHYASRGPVGGPTPRYRQF